MHRCSQIRPRWCVERAIITYRLSGWQAAWMRRVYLCESGGNPYAYYGHPQNRAPTDVIYRGDISAGLYEFKPSTWATQPYAARSIWSAKWQSLAAAWMTGRAGRSSEWACR